ncbi:hypothetical protein SDJN02_01116, partial [Cucurbita argyrosperma subsp. argyrosperma]
MEREQLFPLNSSREFSHRRVATRALHNTFSFVFSFYDSFPFEVWDPYDIPSKVDLLNQTELKRTILTYPEVEMSYLHKFPAIDLHRLGRPGVGCCADARVYKDLSCLLSWRAS